MYQTKRNLVNNSKLVKTKIPKVVVARNLIGISWGVVLHTHTYIYICACVYVCVMVCICILSWKLFPIYIGNSFKILNIRKLFSLSLDIYIYIYIYIYHHYQVPQARISLILSRHFSLSFIASGRSSGQHPVSSHSCWMYAFARPYVGVHRSTSLMSSSLLLQQYPACLVRLTWIVFVIGGRWLYSWCFVGCCRLDLISIARSILV